MKTLKRYSAFLGLGAAVLVSTPSLYADDTEIYLQGIPPGAGSDIIFMIDTSGSGNRATVIEDIADALNRVIDRTSGSTNLGLARYYGGGSPDGSYVAHPVKSMLNTAAAESVSVVNGSGADVYHDGNPVDTSTGCQSGSSFPCPEVQMDGTDTIITDSQTIELSGNSHDRAAFVFDSVAVPRYAKVTEAYIQVQPKVSGVSAGISVDTYRLDGSNPADFTTADTLYIPAISQTSNGSCEEKDDYSTASDAWLCSDTTADKGRVTLTSHTESDTQVVRIPVTNLVQDAVKEQFWCGKQSLALAIGAADKTLAFYTYDMLASDSSILAPRLYVKWDPTSEDKPSGLSGDDNKSCSGGVRLDLASGGNDAMENAGSSDLVTDSSLLVGSTDLLDTITTSKSSGGGKKTSGVSSGIYKMGLRFPSVNFDSSATLSNVLLHYLPEEVTGTGSVVIKPILGDTGEFNSYGEIGSASIGTKSATASPVEADEGVFVSADITTLLNEILADAGWSLGGAMGLTLESNDPDNYAVHIGALEDGNASAAFITMDVLSPAPGDFAPTNRDALKEQVSLLASSQGGGLAAFGQAYIDAATYMRNGPVLTGAKFYDGSEGALTAQQSEWADEIFSSKYSQYAGPNSDNECGKRHVVMLAQKAPGGTSPADLLSTATGGDLVAADCPSNDEYGCLAKFSEWASYPDDANREAVMTHIVGFDLLNNLGEETDASTGFRQVAEASGGEYRNAANIDEVEAAFQEIVDKLTVDNASLAAPGVAVNQLNRFQHLDELYYSVFRPDFFTQWDGNLKRYRLKFTSAGPQIVDINGNLAVDPSTGFFKEDAKSYWSDVEDGNKAVLGGAYGELDSGNTSRKLYYFAGTESNLAPSGSVSDNTFGSGQSLTLMDTDNQPTAAQFGLADAGDLSKAVNFVNTSWGDPLHSEPRLVTYAIDLTNNTQDNVVFVSTNDGILHAIDADDGSERFSFIPPGELLKTQDRMNNIALEFPDYARSTYGLDSTWTPWRRANGTTNPDVYLFGGQRRGGRNMYALDVSDIDASPTPKWLWRIQGGVTAGFDDLGQTWSRPTLAQIKLGGTAVPVLIFGGGYDAAKHDTSGTASAGDDMGNAIYIVNATNGKLIWSASNAATNASAAAHTTVTNMKWSIPADVAGVDINVDGFVDHLYAVDLGGQVFRVDLNLGNSDASELVRRVETVASVGYQESATYLDNRRFHASVSAALQIDGNNNEYLQLVIGTGYRAHPLEKDKTQDRIFMIEDYDIFNAASDSYTSSGIVGTDDLVDLTNNPTPTADDLDGADGNARGWYLSLDKVNGEKILGAAAILDGIVYLSSYVPADLPSNGSCAPIQGRSRLYALNINDASPVYDFNNDGSVDRFEEGVAAGLSPQPQILIGGGDDGDDGDDDGDGSDDSGYGDACSNESQVAILVGTAVRSGGFLGACGLKKTRWWQVDSETEADGVINAQQGTTPSAPSP